MSDTTAHTSTKTVASDSSSSVPASASCCAQLAPTPCLFGETTELLELSPEQIYIINDMINSWIDDPKQYRQAFREDCKRLIASARLAAKPDDDGRGGLYFDPSGDGATSDMTNAQLAMALRNNLSLVDPRDNLQELMAAAAARLVDAPELGVLTERERCAKIAEPWPGFWLDENSTDVDRAVVAVRTEIAEKIRALSTTTEPKRTREGVCPSCGGHGVVRVPVAGGPHTSIAERESHDNEGEG